jgi:GTPase involved in cell partitioning and DNA repair
MRASPRAADRGAELPSLGYILSLAPLPRTLPLDRPRVVACVDVRPGRMGRRQRGFYDQVRILAAAGNGGRGNVCFFRDNRVEMGPPEGGNGGRGGSIIVRACDQMSDLRMSARNFRAEHGANGGTAQCHGRNGKPLTLRVPCGTVVHLLGKATSTQTSRMQPSDSTKVVLAELMNDGDQVVTAKGGAGGRGNMALKDDEKMQGVSQAEEGGSGQVSHAAALAPLTMALLTMAVLTLALLTMALLTMAR